jgi:hypothetical protein
MIAWYALVMGMMILNFYLALLYLCFDSTLSLDIITYFCLPILLIICVVDILISFNTSFVRNGELITDK